MARDGRMIGIALRPACGRRVPRINARSSSCAHPAYIEYASPNTGKVPVLGETLYGQQGSDRIHISSIPSMRPSTHAGIVLCGLLSPFALPIWLFLLFSSAHQ